MQSAPMGGLWKGKAAFDLRHRWYCRGSRICWEPVVPANVEHWNERIITLVTYAADRRRTGAFLRLSRTSQTRATSSLPAIGACPVRDETCDHCYARLGWYRSDYQIAVDRVLRLECLKRLIDQGNLPKWANWMVAELNALPPDEPPPQELREKGLPDTWKRGDGIRYMRWHDSGDLFHADYALAILKVCEATPQVSHWLPTRRGKLINSLVQQGAVIPKNLSVLVSVQRGGKLEQAQVQAVRDVLKAQPSARIGLSYFVICPAGQQFDFRLLQRSFGRKAVLCPSITSQDERLQGCRGCRRCWAADIDAPIIYPKS